MKQDIQLTDQTIITQNKGRCRKNYIKNHIAIDIDTRIILNCSANRDSKYNTQLAMPSIRQLKPYFPNYILVNKAYDSKFMKKCINQELRLFDKIRLKNMRK